MATIKVVNKQTGEYIEYEYDNIDDLKIIYDELYEQKKLTERAINKVKDAIGERVSEDEPYQFADGFTARWMTLPRYEYPKEIVAKYLDPDQLDIVTKVDGTKLKTIIKEMVDRKELEAGAWEHIMSSADVKISKPYVRIDKHV